MSEKIDRKEIGDAGEAAAAGHLEAKGYRIVERNYRAGRGEIDIIAWSPDGGTLVFVEVKTRADNAFGGPIEAVTRHKRNTVLRTAGAYMESIEYEWIVRFDVVAVWIKNGQLIDLQHVEDAFF